MSTAVSLGLQALGLLTVVAVPVGALTSPLWEAALLRWIERRRRAREARSLRLGIRGPR